MHDFQLLTVPAKENIFKCIECWVYKRLNSRIMARFSFEVYQIIVILVSIDRVLNNEYMQLSHKIIFKICSHFLLHTKEN